MFRVLVHIDLYMLLFLASWSVVVIRSAYRLLVDRRLIPDFIMTSHSSIDEAEDQVSYCIISHSLSTFRLLPHNNIGGWLVGQP